MNLYGAKSWRLCGYRWWDTMALSICFDLLDWRCQICNASTWNSIWIKSILIINHCVFQYFFFCSWDSVFCFFFFIQHLVYCLPIDCYQSAPQTFPWEHFEINYNYFREQKTPKKNNIQNAMNSTSINENMNKKKKKLSIFLGHGQSLKSEAL